MRTVTTTRALVLALGTAWGCAQGTLGDGRTPAAKDDAGDEPKRDARPADTKAPAPGPDAAVTPQDGPAPEPRVDAAAPPRDAGVDAAPATPVDTGAGPSEPAAPKRDPFLWPFAKTSIWNTPIGSGAVWKPANLEAAGNVGADIQHILKLRATDPARAVFDSPTWGPGRCSGKTDLGMTIRVPDDWIVPDAGNSPYGGTPNGNFALLEVDGDTLFQGSVISRCAAGGPVYLPDWMKFPGNQGRESVRGDGISGGGQGASGMSALGGTIRKGELVGAAPIRHAIKVNPWAKKYCFYDATTKGFRWPAKRADNYADKEYGGKNKSLVMGTLFAIPPEVTEASLGLKNAAAKKLFFAMQNYGVYFTEDAAWDTWDLIIERDAEKDLETTGASISSPAWRTELNALMKALAIVDNNGPTSVGGGGTPRQPLAPDFKD